MSEDLRSETGDFAIGSKIGRYLLEEQIGHGGMAAVFKARDERLGRVVALKILAPALAADQAFRRRFIRESRAAAAVDDPHIIPLYEAGDADGVLFIAMRFVPGGDVRSLLDQEGPLPAQRVAAIVAPVGSALDAAHATGLVHRDVKPANMLLDVRQGRPDHVYLSDFGLSKDATGSAPLTGTGMFVGTVDYVAPEQINSLQVDGRADQYALGCAAFEMLCGEPPFRRDHSMAVLAAHVSQTPPLASAKRAGLSPAVDAVFARVLAKKAEDRYPTCGEFSDALRNVLEPEAAVRDSATAWPPASHPPTERARVQQAYSPPGPPIDHPAYPASTPVPSAWDATIQPPRPAPRWPNIIATVAVGAALVAVAIVFVAKSLHPSPTAGPSRSSGPATHGSQKGSGRNATPTSHRTWIPYQDPGEFSINLPPGWAPISTGADGVKFAGSPRGFVVVIEWTRSPRPDAYTDWQQQSSAKAAADSSYHLISIERVSYRGYNSADWQFTEAYPAQRENQFLDRGFIVHPGRLGFAIELYGPPARFPAVRASLWRRLITSFQPAS